MNYQNNLDSMYTNLLNLFDLEGEYQERLSICTLCSFKNVSDASHQSKEFINKHMSPLLLKRKPFEEMYYQKIQSDLCHKLDEMKAYSEIDVETSRRLTTSSNDCISLVQILIRDEIHLNVYFRSSDILGALPIDLEFLSCLPKYFIDFLDTRNGLEGYEKFVDIKELKEKAIQLNLMFGSLHKF